MSEKTLPSPEVISKLPPDGGPHYNRLIHERSPYLLQHAANPVDWHPWGDAAFEKARADNKPIFLSIGYSTCHWCHVMERESFENEQIAKILNENFIPIKVDREERPDIDEIYMKATQLVTGGGGWPNSLWLTPDGRPWFAGTYFPPQDAYGRPGFRTVLLSLAEYWETRPDDVETQAEQIREAMERMSSVGDFSGTGKLSSLLIERSLESHRESFDSGWGGFGGAPKFPPHGSISLIFDQYQRTGDQSDLDMALNTLKRMAAGGIHDHLGGGFHRYSTDARWLTPHFEKMLYDNAQLSRAYVDAYLISGDEDFRVAAVGTYDWVLREMTDSKGGFYSAIDADSEGEEGKFYVWGRDEVISILGEEEGDLFCSVYNVRTEGNFSDEATGNTPGTNIIHLEKPIDEIAADLGLEQSDLRRRLAESRKKLLERRDQRVHPYTDDKVLTSWNGLMIGSLAYGGLELDEPRYTAAAGRATDFILAEMYRDGRLLRSFREGGAGLNAYLDDYAFLIHGLLELYGEGGGGGWRRGPSAVGQGPHEGPYRQLPRSG
ncbi:thioredoxin domain-containing protein [candidate division KSB1 bacterium]